MPSLYPSRAHGARRRPVCRPHTHLRRTMSSKPKFPSNQSIQHLSPTSTSYRLPGNIPAVPKSEFQQQAIQVLDKLKHNQEAHNKAAELLDLISAGYKKPSTIPMALSDKTKNRTLMDIPKAVVNKRPGRIIAEERHHNIVKEQILAPAEDERKKITPELISTLLSQLPFSPLHNVVHPLDPNTSSLPLNSKKSRMNDSHTPAKPSTPLEQFISSTNSTLQRSIEAQGPDKTTLETIRRERQRMLLQDETWDLHENQFHTAQEKETPLDKELPKISENDLIQQSYQLLHRMETIRQRCNAQESLLYRMENYVDLNEIENFRKANVNKIVSPSGNTVDDQPIPFFTPKPRPGRLMDLFNGLEVAEKHKVSKKSVDRIVALQRNTEEKGYPVPLARLRQWMKNPTGVPEIDDAVQEMVLQYDLAKVLNNEPVPLSSDRFIGPRRKPRGREGTIAKYHLERKAKMQQAANTEEIVPSELRVVRKRGRKPNVPKHEIMENYNSLNQSEKEMVFTIASHTCNELINDEVITFESHTKNEPIEAEIIEMDEKPVKSKQQPKSTKSKNVTELASSIQTTPSDSSKAIENSTKTNKQSDNELSSPQTLQISTKSPVTHDEDSDVLDTEAIDELNDRLEQEIQQIQHKMQKLHYAYQYLSDKIQDVNDKANTNSPFSDTEGNPSNVHKSDQNTQQQTHPSETPAELSSDALAHAQAEYDKELMRDEASDPSPAEIARMRKVVYGFLASHPHTRVLARESQLPSNDPNIQRQTMEIFAAINVLSELDYYQERHDRREAIRARERGETVAPPSELTTTAPQQAQLVAKTPSYNPLAHPVPVSTNILPSTTIPSERDPFLHNFHEYTIRGPATHPFDSFDPIDQVFRPADGGAPYPPPELREPHSTALTMRLLADGLKIAEKALPSPGLQHQMYYMIPGPNLTSRQQGREYQKQLSQDLIARLQDAMVKVEQAYDKKLELIKMDLVHLAASQRLKLKEQIATDLLAQSFLLPVTHKPKNDQNVNNNEQNGAEDSKDAKVAVKQFLREHLDTMKPAGAVPALPSPSVLGGPNKLSKHQQWLEEMKVVQQRGKSVDPTTVASSMTGTAAIPIQQAVSIPVEQKVIDDINIKNDSPAIERANVSLQESIAPKKKVPKANAMNPPFNQISFSLKKAGSHLTALNETKH